jgi:soluble lytic murein transglycosylase
MAVLERIIETYPSKRHSQLATLKMALYYMDRKHYARSTAIVEKSLKRSGRRNQELLYYLASTYGQMGKEEKKNKILEEIEELDPNSFYLDANIKRSFAQPITSASGRVALNGERGLLQFLKQVFDERQNAYGRIRELLDPLEDDGSLAASAVYLQRGRQFLQMGFRDWGERELMIVETERKLPARISFELGVLYDDFAMHWKSTRAFQRAYYSLKREVRREYDREFKLLLHPLPYPAHVFENCARYQMPPHLIYAMMRRESWFDLNAVSRAGAVGLMQLMPATGEQVASELGFPDGVRPNLLLPEVNLTFGIWYASHLLRRSNDDPLMMLAAYNAGFGNAKRWFGKGGGNAVVAKVDGIGYRETREYVKRIVEAARIYHSSYFAPDRGSARGLQ